MAKGLARIPGQLSLTAARDLETKIGYQYRKADGEVAELRRMMLQFDEGKGWRSLNYSNFGAWAARKLPQYGKAYHSRLLSAATTERDCLGEEYEGHEPLPERVLREFNQVPQSRRREAFLKAQAMAKEKPGKGGSVDVTLGVAHKAAQLFPAASVDAKPADVKDERGVGVGDDALKAVFEASAGFDTVMSLLARVKMNLQRLVEGPAGAILAQEINQIEVKRDWIYRTVRFARPFAICIYCGGDPRTRDKCKACKGAGYLNEDRHKQAPKAPK
jgi:hypothetical protein